QGLLKFIEAGLAFEKDDGERNAAGKEASDEREQDGTGFQVDGVEGDEEGGDAHQDEPACSPLQIGLIKEMAEPWGQLHLEQEAVEEGNRAEQFCLTDINDGIGGLGRIGA